MTDIYIARIEMGPSPNGFLETSISNSLFINSYGNLIFRYTAYNSNQIEYFPNGNFKKVGWCELDYYSNSSKVLSITNTDDGHLRFDYRSIRVDKITSTRGVNMEFFYLSDGRIEKIYGTNKGAIIFRYDASGRLKEISSSIGTLKIFSQSIRLLLIKNL